MEYKSNKKMYYDSTNKIAELEDEKDSIIEAIRIVQVVAENTQQKAHAQISGIVTKCLQYVFGEEYEFEIQFKQARNKTVPELVFRKFGRDTDPLEETGGGVVDVLAFGLKLASLMLTVPRNERILFLDEPFKHLSEGFVPKIIECLHDLSKKMDFQFIVITQNTEMRIGKVHML